MPKITENRQIYLTQIKEQLKQDTLLGHVGLLATTAAHELSTPLSTMGHIADELIESNIDKRNASLLKKQVSRSKSLLQEILLSFGTVRIEELRKITIQDYSENLKQACSYKYPQAMLNIIHSVKQNTI